MSGRGSCTDSIMYSVTSASCWASSPFKLLSHTLSHLTLTETPCIVMSISVFRWQNGNSEINSGFKLLKPKEKFES